MEETLVAILSEEVEGEEGEEVVVDWEELVAYLDLVVLVYHRVPYL